LGAVAGTKLLATFIAVYGILMPALGWKFAGLVWGYALVWFLIEDQVKLGAYRTFSHPLPAMFPKWSKL